MPIKVTCPKCQGVLHAPDDAGGKRGKCPTCGTVLAIPADGPRAAAPSPLDGPVLGGPAVDRPFGESSTTFNPPPAGHPHPAGSAAGEPYRFAPADDPRRSSGLLNKPGDGRTGSANRLPPPAFGPPEPRKPADPFAKPGKPGARPDDDVVRAWRRAGRGLWWVRLGLFLYLLPVLGLAGIAVADNYGTKLPQKSPGYLKIDGLSTDREIKGLVVLVPVVLGLLATTTGRFGVAGVPRASFAKGLARAAALATLLGLLGAIAAGVPTGGQIATLGLPRWGEWLPKDDPNGIAQRAGAVIAAVFLPLAELWFVVALGRMGAGLHDQRLAGRGTRFLVLAGLALAAGAFAYVGSEMYAKEVHDAYVQFVAPQWDKLGEHRPAAAAGLAGFGGLVVWFWYARLVGGARRAVRGWVEYHAPAA